MSSLLPGLINVEPNVITLHRHPVLSSSSYSGKQLESESGNGGYQFAKVSEPESTNVAPSKK